jgi:hypothetical protein
VAENQEKLAVPQESEKTSHFPWWILLLRHQGPALWEAKWAVLVLLAIVIPGTYWFVDNSYKSTLQAKDATIQTKDAIIDRQKKEMEMAGVSSSPLKTRALILSKQLVEAMNSIPTNAQPYTINDFHELAGRFSGRLEKIRGELDERGQRIERLDKLVHLFSYAPGNLGRDEVLQMAADVKTLAENIKE